MITRTSQPASGAMLIAEMKEFAGFAKATQRYVRRSLDAKPPRSAPRRAFTSNSTISVFRCRTTAAST